MTATPPIVDRETWQEQIDALRVREKAHTREGDVIAAARRRLPMVEVDPATQVVGAAGEVPLIHTFEGRSQLFAYWTTARGCEPMGNSYGMLDMTVYGRQEQREDSPEGWPQPYGVNGLQFREVRDEDRQGRLPGRPISQWSRLAAGRSDDLGSAAVATDTHHCH